VIWKINRAILIALFALGGLTAPLLILLTYPKGEWSWVAIGVFNLISCPAAVYELWRAKT